MSEREEFVVYVADPIGECQFCEYGELHESGYGFVCVNKEGMYYQKHLQSDMRGQNTGCKVWEFWKLKDE